jgi:hypothetical protein
MISKTHNYIPSIKPIQHPLKSLAIAIPTFPIKAPVDGVTICFPNPKLVFSSANNDAKPHPALSLLQWWHCFGVWFFIVLKGVLSDPF